MTSRWNAVLVELDDDRLCGVVAEILAPVVGPDAIVTEVRREPSPFASLFPAEVLSVTMSGRPPLRVFLKHLGPEQARQPDKLRRDREVRVYEELLGDHRLAVPRYYGSRWNAVTGRQELYLEHLDDWHLKYHGLEHWFAASRQLARFHAHFAAHRGLLRRCDFLLALDARYFIEWARRAGASVSEHAAPLAPKLEPVLGAYGHVARLLARQPVTLVHNDLAPKNVIVDRSGTPARICFVDWETAGMGCALLDLAHLKYGLDSAGDREMTAAYRAELGGTDLIPAADAEFDRLLAACELHKTLYRLAHCASLGATRSTVDQWVTDARAHLERVRAGGSSVLDRGEWR